MKNFFIIISLIVLGACSKPKKNIVDVSEVSVIVDIDRFEQKFYNTNETTLPKLKGEYPYLFPSFNHDSIWINKINNLEERTYFDLSQKLFGEFKKEKNEIEDLFKHIKTYHPSFKEPKVITLISKLDYLNKVIYADSLLFVSLDMYLGRNNMVYDDFPEYISHNFDKDQVVVDIALAISEKNLNAGSHRQFLDIIINEGKKMYLLDCYLPTVSDARKMGYSQEKIVWAELNETEVWKYFIEKELLYSTDSKLYARFVAEAPFSKFYIDIDSQSPGRIGTWLGWQIVRAYMNNNDVTLPQLMQAGGVEIFNKSKYKPKK